jgi:hypothetical protein
VSDIPRAISIGRRVVVTGMAGDVFRAEFDRLGPVTVAMTGQS